MPKNNKNNKKPSKIDSGEGGSKGADTKSPSSVKSPKSLKSPKTPNGYQSVNVRHILCEKHANKELALARLNNGDPFNKVAEDFSEDKRKQGGSLGWQTKGSLNAAFEELCKELEVSTTTSPKWGEVKTEFGYHIVMIEGRK